MFEKSKFSLEYVFQECNLHNHCIHLTLKVPVVIRGEKVRDVYVMEVITTEEEQKAIMKNIAAGINTNNAALCVKVFTDKARFDYVTVGISTNNIEEAELRG